MNKSKKLKILALGILPVFVLGGIYTYRVFVLGRYHSTEAYGVEVSYPATWRESSYQFHTTIATTRPGIIVSSPDDQIKLAVSPKYVGDTSVERSESSNIRAEAMLVASTPLKNASGISAVQVVTHYYGEAVASHYVASDMLMTDKQLYTSSLKFNKMTKINANENLAIPLNNAQPEAAVGFNSQRSLTLDQAVDWFKTSNARTAHSILVSVKLRS